MFATPGTEALNQHLKRRLSDNLLVRSATLHGAVRPHGASAMGAGSDEQLDSNSSHDLYVSRSEAIGRCAVTGSGCAAFYGATQGAHSVLQHIGAC